MVCLENKYNLILNIYTKNTYVSRRIERVKLKNGNRRIDEGWLQIGKVTSGCLIRTIADKNEEYDANDEFYIVFILS